MKKFGVIGAGNMASAIIGGVLKKKVFAADEICASASRETSRNLLSLREEYHISITGDNRAAAEDAEIILLAVKPQQYADVIREIAPVVTDKQLVISIAAGKSLAWLSEQFGKDVKLIRTMPNTPALVGEGMTGFCCGKGITAEDREKALVVLSAIGLAEEVTESQMDAVVAVSGSSPAYIFMLIEAMADAAVAEGMKREQAYRFAEQAVLGSAKLALETGKHPAVLKDMVCSPAGTTIEAVRALEESGFRAAIEDAMAVCAEKSRSM